MRLHYVFLHFDTAVAGICETQGYIELGIGDEVYPAKLSMGSSRMTLRPMLHAYEGAICMNTMLPIGGPFLRQPVTSGDPASVGVWD